MKSLKDYANEHRISYEAVRKQVVRYEKELEGHITKQGKKQFLDDYAVNFLDERRNNNVVTVLSEDIQNESAKAAEYQKKYEQALERIIQLEEENKKGIEAAAKLQLIEANHEELKAEREELTTKVAQLETEKAQLQKENASFVKTIFGLYKKTN